jgi:hypothetical protein
MERVLMMETRTITTQVTFLKPFRLEGMEREQPPGSYTIDTEEEQLDTLTFVGWRQVSATMRISYKGATEYVPIGSRDLLSALLRDGVSTTEVRS